MGISLNIGCQQLYKPGYINIDETNNIIADTVSQANELPFDDNSVDTIKSYNLIEQFTYEKAISSLEEWYRVLKEGGQLIIEVTNIELLIDEYKKSEAPEEKDNALKLLYENKSETIKYLSAYYFGKLRRDLLKIGFDQIEEEPAKFNSYKEAFRVVCYKNEESTFNMIRVKSKKEALKDLDYIKLHNIKILKEFNEVIIDTLLSTILSKTDELEIIKNNNFHKIIAYSPKLATIFIDECLKYNLLNKTQHDIIKNTANSLIKHNMIWATYNNIIEKEKQPGYKINYYIEILEKNANFIGKLVLNTNTDLDTEIINYLATISDTQKSFSIELSKDIFSYELLKSKAIETELIATKLFANKSYKEAYINYTNALKLDPELMLSYINKGLLEILSKNITKANALFNHALELTESDDDNDIVLLNTAACQLYLKNYHETIRMINHIKTDSSIKFQILACAYLHIKEYNEAIEAFSWASILEPNLENILNHTFILDITKNKKEADKLFNQARSIDPQIKRINAPIMPKFNNTPYSKEDL
ncbi:MAG: methyltransferase domain-containing protein [Vampirovibrionia bacterium]